MKNVISIENMRESDANVINNDISISHELMYKAALGVFSNVEWKGNIGLVSGKGNNGGDNYALALILLDHNISSTIIDISDEVSKDARYYYDLTLEKKIKHIKIDDIDNLKDFDILVDGIFGTGFKGVPDGKYKKAIDMINESNAYVVSIDINSGLNGNSGLGSNIVKSNKTISIGNLKYGHYLNMAKDVMDEVINVDIGIPLLYEEAKLIEKDDLRSFFKKRKNMSNKGTYGYVGILGGSSKYIGAVKLAHLGQEALYAGAGVSKVIVPASIGNLLYPHVLETTIFLMPINENNDMAFDEDKLIEATSSLKAIGVGVGWGISEDNKKILEYLLNNLEIPLVIDADGLNILSKMDLEILNKTKCKVILTPHLKEFSRLTNMEVKDLEKDLIKYAKDFVSKYHVTLLLKGPTTIISSKEGMYLSSSGTPGMATGGSGDVLLGVLVGLLGYNQIDILKTVAYGAYINGLGGEYAIKEYGDISMVASDTARCISKVIKDITSTDK